MKMLKRKCIRAMALASSASIAMIGSASAQVDNAQSNEAGEPEYVAPKDHILVTARKRGAESLQDVPASISALPSEELTSFGVQGAADYIRLIPGLSAVDQGPGQTKLIIRGVTTGATTPTAIGEGETAGLYLDDTPITVNSQNPDLALYDIQQLEVLRGPQGTLYGAGAMSGAIIIRTKQPNLSEMEGYVSVQSSHTAHGDFNYGVNGAISVPLIQDKLALRVVGYHRFDDGYLDDIAPLQAFSVDATHAYEGNPNNVDGLATGPGTRENANWYEVHGGRANLLFQPTEQLSISGNVIWQQADQGARFFARTSPVPGFDFGPYEQFRLTKEKTPDESLIGNVTIKYDLGWGEFVSSTSRNKRTINVHTDLTTLVELAWFGLLLPAHPALVRPQPFPTVVTTNESTVEDFVEEARLSGRSFDDRLSWVGGIFYSNRDRNYIQHLQSSQLEFVLNQQDPTFSFDEYGSINIVDTYQFVGTDQFAVFGEATLDLTDKLAITAGARWFQTKVAIEQLFTGVPFPESPVTGSTKENGFNPKASIAYRASDNFLLFATAGKGYRPGGVNNPVSGIPACVAELAAIGINDPDSVNTFDSDSLWNYEAGVKASTDDNNLTVSVTGYHIVWSDLQITNRLPNPCALAYTANVGKATSDGVEGEVNIRPIDGLKLTLSGSYTDAKLAIDYLAAGASKGDNVPYLPKVSVQVLAQYDFALTSDSDAFINGSIAYVGEQFSGFEGAGIHHPDYAIGNLRIGVSKDNWTVSAFANNILDEYARTYIAPDFFHPPAGNDINIVRPRTIGIEVRTAF